MLILTQRPFRENESVVITVPPSREPVQITVTLLGVKGNQARLGYDAPRTVTIDRASIHEKKLKEASGGNR